MIVVEAVMSIKLDSSKVFTAPGITPDELE